MFVIWLNNSKPGLYNGVPCHNWKSSQGIVRRGTELWIYPVVSNREIFKNGKSLGPACPRSLNQNHWGWSLGIRSVYKLDLHCLCNSLPRKEGKENSRVTWKSSVSILAYKIEWKTAYCLLLLYVLLPLVLVFLSL